MSELKTIQGFRIKALAADPSNLQVGDVWYNTTDDKLRVAGIGAAVWSTGGSLAVARNYSNGTGPQTAALCVGGLPNPPSVITTSTEVYDGSTWTAGGAANHGSSNGDVNGSNSSCIYYCGDGTPWPSFTDRGETYASSTWTTSPAVYPEAHTWMGGCGTKTAAMGMGGDPTTSLAAKWNDTSWSATPALNTNVSNNSGAGINTDALCIGSPSAATTVQSWNDTSWSASPALNTGRSNSSSNCTSATASFVCGGAAPAILDSTEIWDDSSWSVGATMPGPRTVSSGGGTTSAAITFGGSGPTTAAPFLAAAYELNAGSTEAFDITTS